MALFNTLKQILTPYANKINLHTEEIEEIQSDVSDVKADLDDTNDQLNGLIESSFEVDRGLLSVSSENFTDMRASQGWNSLVISYNEHNDGFSVYHTANYNERFCWSFPVEATKTYTITFESTSTDWVKVGVASAQTVNEANWTEIPQINGKYALTFTVNQSINAYYLCFALKNAGIGQANAITISGIICDEGDTAQLGYAILESAIPSTIVRQANYYSLVAPSYIDLVNDGKWFFYDEGVIDTNDIHASDVYQINSFGGTEPIQQFPTQGIRESDLTDYATGHYTNRLYMCNTYDNNNIDSQLCVINVYDVPTNPSAPKNILMIGDSLTANNYLPYYFQKYLADNGLTNYVTVGRRKATVHGVTYDDCKYEAEGGYSWPNYVDNPNTLPSGFPNNYFWNPTTNELDISYYMDTYANGANLDYVLINLGWNSLVNQNYWHGMNQTISEIETKAKAFINQVHTEYPNAKVLLTGIQKAPWDGAAFVSNANKPTLYNIRLARAFCSKLNALYKSIATDATYNGYLRFNQVSFQFNPYTGMPYKAMDTDAFTGNTIPICENYVHPSENGYKMFARSIWGGFVGLLNN